MTPRRVAALCVTGTLLAAWIAAAAAPTLAPDPVPPPQSPPPDAPDRQVLDLAEDAERLRARLNVVLVPRPVTRNPFHFAVTRKAESPEPHSAVSDPAPSAPVGPPVTLLGVAQDGAGDTVERTAILSVNDELQLVKEGALVGGSYRLVRIGADLIELEHTSDSRPVRITLPQ